MYFKEFADIFSEKKTAALPDHAQVEHAIELKLGKQFLHKLIYSLSEIKLKILHKYLKFSFKKKWIQLFKSSADTLILFVLKKNEFLWFCVNYRELNLIIIKNHYFLLLINKILNYLFSVSIFTQLDLQDTYTCISIKKSDKWKTAFHM